MRPAKADTLASRPTDLDTLPAEVLADLRGGLLPLGLIDETDYPNPRGSIDIKTAEWNDFEASIKAHGRILQAVGVAPKTKNGKYPLVFGWRRLTAARRLKLAGVPITFQPHVTTPGAALIAGATENTAREGMTPLAEANVIRQLMDGGETQARAARLLGVSERTARDRLNLLKLPGDVAGALDNGIVALDAVRLLMRIADTAPAAATALVHAVEKGDIYRSDIADTDILVQDHLRYSPPSPRGPSLLCSSQKGRFRALYRRGSWWM